MVNIKTYNCEKKYDEKNKVLMFKPIKEEYKIIIENDNKFSFNLKTKNNVILLNENNKSLTENNKKHVEVNKKITFIEKNSLKEIIYLKNFKINKKISYDYCNFENNFDIYYINLKKRNDRNKSIENEFKKANITNYSRFEAIEPTKNDISISNKIDINSLWKINGKSPDINNENDYNYIKGCLGCKLSHYNILKNFFTKSNKKYLLVFEDDVVLDKNIKQNISTTINYIETNNILFNILYLSVNIHGPNPENKLIQVGENLLKIRLGHGNTTHAMIFNKYTVENVLKYIKNSKNEIDNVYKNIQDRYVFNPMITYQKEGPSDIGEYREIENKTSKGVFYGDFTKKYNLSNLIKSNEKYLIYTQSEIQNNLNKKLYALLKNELNIIEINKLFNNEKKIIVFNPLNYSIKKNLKYILIYDNIEINDITKENIKNSYYTIVFSLDNLEKYIFDFEIYKKILLCENEEQINAIFITLKLMDLNNYTIKLEQDKFNVLTLSTSKTRLEQFKSANDSLIKNFNIINGIKYNPGFIGCGLSYKMILSNASKLNFDYIKICEDDCKINNIDIINKAIEHLITSGLSWDLLSCFIVDLNDGLEIYEQIELDSEYKLLKINQWSSMVCNIYSKSSYGYFNEYLNNKIDKKDVFSNTIDRSLKFKDIWVIYPYPVELINSKSELWNDPKNNGYNIDEYNKMKEKSCKIIDNKIKKDIFKIFLNDNNNKKYETTVRISEEIFFENIITITNNMNIKYPKTIYKTNLTLNNVFDIIKENNIIDNILFILSETNNHTDYVKFQKDKLLNIIDESDFDIVNLNFDGEIDELKKYIVNSIGIYKTNKIGNCFIVKKNVVNKMLNDLFFDIKNLSIGYLNRPVFCDNEISKLWYSYYNVTNYWDKIYCFNLGFDIIKRNEMYKYCNLLNYVQKDFFVKGHLGINLPDINTLIDMNIYNKKAINYDLKKGTIGLNISQKELLKKINKNNYEYILILEDDIYFNIDYFLILDEIFKKYKDIDILILGHSYYDELKHNELFEQLELLKNNYKLLKPKKNILKKICMGGFFAVLLSKKAVKVYLDRYNPINNISDILLCDIIFDIKKDFTDNKFIKTDNGLNSFVIYKKIHNIKSEYIYGLFGTENKKLSLTEENSFNLIYHLKNNKYLNFLSKIQNIIFKNNNNYHLKIYVSNDVKLWYSNLVDVLVKIFNKVVLSETISDDIDIFFLNKFDKQINCNNDKSIYLYINGEKEDIENNCDIGILTTYKFKHPYNIYLPQCFSSLWERRTDYKKQYFNTKEKFCAYMYSYDLEYRVELFNYISKYKKVDAIGKSCNNNLKNNDRFTYNDNETYNDLAVKKYLEYKFVLALENGIVPGYFTEKIINPIIANSIPIYAGSIETFKYFNKKRVIYIYDFKNYEELLNYIIEVDNDDKLYNKIISEEIFIGNITWDNYEQYIVNELKKCFGLSPKNIILKNDNKIYHHYNERFDMKINYDYSNLSNKYLKTYFSDFIDDQDNIIDELNYKFMGISHIAWINLDRAKDRFVYITKLFNGLNVKNTRIVAVDGKNENVREMIKPNETSITDYEIACTLSHIKALSFLNNLDGEYFLVCEDDIKLDNIYLINENIETIIKNAPDFEILLIYKNSLYKFQNNYEYYKDLNKSTNFDEHIYGTCCYIITKTGLSKILKKMHFTNNKFIINDSNIKPADYYLYENIKTCIYKYNFIDTLNETSLIHIEHLDFHLRSSKFQNEIIINDFKCD